MLDWLLAIYKVAIPILVSSARHPDAGSPRQGDDFPLAFRYRGMAKDHVWVQVFVLMAKGPSSKDDDGNRNGRIKAIHSKSPSGSSLYKSTKDNFSSSSLLDSSAPYSVRSASTHISLPPSPISWGYGMKTHFIFNRGWLRKLYFSIGKICQRLHRQRHTAAASE